MLKLGDKNITKLYYGDKAISKVYWGEKLVFQADDGGRFVKSIVFDGQSYIKTGITKEQGYDGTWTIKAKCYLQEQVTGYTVLLGCGERGGRYYGKNSQDKWGLGVSAGRYFDISGDILTEAEVIFNPSKITAMSGGVTLTLTGDFSTYNGSEFIIGKGLDEDSYGYAFIGEVDGCQYVDIDGNLVQDLRPYVDKNGVACFKDVVTNTLLYGQGAGTLKAVDIIQEPTHTEIEYLEGDSVSFIDTGVIGKSGVSIDMEIEFPSRMSGNTYFVGCSQSSTEMFYVPFLYNGGRWSLYIKDSYGKYGTTMNANTKYHIVVETSTTGATLYIDGVQQATSSGVVTSGTNTIYLFGVNNNGTPLIGNTYYTDSTGYIKISACKINVDGTLVRDYIPVERTDGVKCLYDKVEGKYEEFQTA